MRRVCYSVAMSLDGYILGPNGEVDWILMDPDIDFAGYMESFDTLIMGRKTYEFTRTQSGGGGRMSGVQSYVFSRTLRQEDCPGVIVSDEPKKIITKLKDDPNFIRIYDKEEYWNHAKTRIKFSLRGHNLAKSWKEENKESKEKWMRMCNGKLKGQLHIRYTPEVPGSRKKKGC